ncbi:MAG: sporulation integral membrane protein YtvI [Eubacterium sp.]
MEYEKKKKFIVNVVYGGLIILLAFILLKYGLSLVAPFLIAFLVAFFLRKPAVYLSKKIKIPYKPVALLLVLVFYCTVGILIALVGVKIFSSVVEFFFSLPKFYSYQIEPSLSSFFNWIEAAVYRMDPTLMQSLNELFTQFIKALGELVSGLSMKIVGAVSGYASSLPGLFIKLLLMVIATFFIAGDYEVLSSFILRQFSGKAKDLMIRIKEYVVGTLFVCIRSYALIMSITFLELAVGLTLVKIPNSFMIAFLISIFDILPVLGTGGIMIPWVIITALRGNYPLAIGLLVIYLVITVVRNIIEPKIVGSQIGLHPVVTLVSMFVGVQLFGVIGLFGFPILLSLLRHLNDTGTITLFK